MQIKRLRRIWRNTNGIQKKWLIAFTQDLWSKMSFCWSDFVKFITINSRVLNAIMCSSRSYWSHWLVSLQEFFFFFNITITKEWYSWWNYTFVLSVRWWFHACLRLMTPQGPQKWFLKAEWGMSIVTRFPNIQSLWSERRWKQNLTLNLGEIQIHVLVYSDPRIQIWNQLLQHCIRRIRFKRYRV